MKILSQELRKLQTISQWVAYERRPKPDKPSEFSKLPLNPKTGRGAMANNPATWGTFEEALCYAERNGLFELDTDGKPRGGVGFELGNGYAGIDLDHVVLPDGALKPFAQDIVRIMNSYTEYSPSGTGLHILFTVDGSPEDWKSFLSGKLGTKVGDIEFYTGTHYLTVTGKPYGEVKPLENRTKQVQEIYRKYLFKHDEHSAKPQRDYQPDLTDSELLERMFNSQNGYEVRALFSGDLSRHGGDHSAADLSLCSHLAFWTNGDANQIDTLFRKSGLMRDKWDRQTAGSTYGAITINKAIQTMREGYTGREAQSVEWQNAEKPTNTGEEVLPVKPKSESEKGEQDINIARERFERESVAYHLDKFMQTVERNKAGGGIQTGFDNLDKLLDGGLYPGLYVIGANSSLGKTTLVLQIADSIAKSGRGVLIFSLEMATDELIAKTLSRLSLIKSLEEYTSTVYAKTTRNILLGRYHNEYDSKIAAQSIQEYHEWGKNIHITEGIGNVEISNIKEKIEEFKQFRKEPPVVVIDYLQILAPYSIKMTDKQNVDKNITELKRLSRDFDIPVLGISSFNRESYTAPVSMASFKESGAIEYSSDVLIGLQYNGWDYQEGEADGVRQKRLRELGKSMEQKARNLSSQDIQLKILKNRNGVKGSLLFDFFPAFNYFRPQIEG